MTGDNGRYEATVEWLRAGRERTDGWRLRVGLRALRMERDYGSAVIPTLAKDAGMGRSTLYEYGQVMDLLLRWKGLSARRIFEDEPCLSYSHLRRAVRLPFEDAVEALLAVNDPDHLADSLTDTQRTRFTDMMPLTPDAFGVYISTLAGRPVPAAPVFDMTGYKQEVLSAAALAQHRLNARKIRFAIWEVE